MTRAWAACCLAICLATLGAAEAAPPKNPVEQVVKLMEKLSAKISEEAKVEAAAYDKYACFCKDQADEKFYSISTKTQRIDELAAAIKKATMDIEDLTQQMNAAVKQRDHLEKEAKETADKDVADHADYTKMHDDIVAGLEQLDKAIAAIKESTDLTSKDMLLQFGATVQRALAEETEEEHQGSDPHAYENKGGKSLETLMKIKAKFTKRLLTIEDWESNRAHSVAMEQQARQFEITTQSELITQCQKTIGEKQTQKGRDQSEHDSLSSDRADDQAFLDKVTEECEDKATKWDARSQRRFGELKAIATAVQILKGDATAKYDANKMGLAQKGKGTVSLLQVAATSDNRWARARKAAVGALQAKAEALKSSQLLAFAMLLRGSDSPFDSVKRLVEELIDKIDAEQKSEDEEIEDCKKDIMAATMKKHKSGGKIEGEEAKVIELGSLIEYENREIEELGKEIAETYKALDEATKIRTTESKENKECLADSKAGLDSVQKAIKALKKFYDGEYVPGLLQTGARVHRREDPEGAPASADFLGDDEAADPAHNEDSQGIFGLLETIKGDYSSTIDTVTDEESQAQSDYDNFKSTSEADIQDKKDTKAAKESSVKQAFDDTEQAKADLAEYTKEKAEAEHELSILEPRCLALGASAEMRKKRREEEKKALKDAITILEAMAPAEAPEPSESESFLQRRRAHRA